MLPFLVTPCLVVAVQPCMERIPIKKKYIQDTQLEVSTCRALSLTGTIALLSELEACHRTKQKDWRFDAIFKKKSLNGKPNNLLELMSEKLIVSDAMCYENHQVFYRCRQLKRQSLTA